MSGQMRQNIVNNDWVIYAPSRGRRPNDFSLQNRDRELPPDHDPDCPFCPGNEDKLPAIVDQQPPEGPWMTRVTPNKFPALDDKGDSRRYMVGPYLAMRGWGRHQVIIESPRHNAHLAGMGAAELECLVETYRRTYINLSGNDESMLVLIFRNHGAQAGTSLIHPHSQAVVSNVAPNYIRWRDSAAQAHFDAIGQCVMCQVLERELSEGTRVLYEDSSFAAFVPFAAETPFEIWLVPLRHQASFSQIRDHEAASLARSLGRVLGLLKSALGDPDYNYVIISAPQYKEREPHLHWHIQIKPRLTTRAGFEIGSGISINPSLPEKDAAFLRGD